MTATASSQLETFPTGAPPRTRRISSFVKIGDVVFYLLTLGSALSIIVLTSLVAYQLFYHSTLARHTFGWSFLFSSEWNPVEGQFGALPFIYGTVVTSLLAMAIAVPLGVATAIFLTEVASTGLARALASLSELLNKVLRAFLRKVFHDRFEWLGRAISYLLAQVTPSNISAAMAFLIDLLAAVPSVIYGLLGIFLLLPLLSNYVIPPLQKTLGFLPIFSGPFYGVSLLSAGIILAIMIIPFVISISREVLLSVPREQREGSYALGATQWETVWHVVLPYAKRGIIGSAFLALARALGETMAVTMVIGNDPKIAKSLLAPGYTVAAVIANEFTEATGDDYLSALIFLGLVLFGITFVINGLARLMVLTFTESHPHA